MRGILSEQSHLTRNAKSSEHQAYHIHYFGKAYNDLLKYTITFCTTGYIIQITH